MVGVLTQPTSGSQACHVQTLLSSQLRVTPPQWPLVQTSFTVQIAPSSHGAPFATGTFVQAPAVQASVVQVSPSSQSLASLQPAHTA